MNNIEFNDITVDTDQKCCLIKGDEVKLTKSEYELLEFLVTHPNKVFSRKEIIQQAWDSDSPLRAVDSVVSRLRKKLGDSSTHIYTRQGFGYGFK